MSNDFSFVLCLGNFSKRSWGFWFENFCCLGVVFRVFFIFYSMFLVWEGEEFVFVFNYGLRYK